MSDGIGVTAVDKCDVGATLSEARKALKSSAKSRDVGYL
jgi:hypothetical protein